MKKTRWLWWIGGIVLFVFLYVMGPHGSIRILHLLHRREKIKKEIKREKVEYEIYRIKIKKLLNDKEYYEEVKKRITGEDKEDTLKEKVKGN